MSMVDFNFNTSEKIKETIGFISQTFAKTKMSKIIVATSGGVDSSVALALCVKAVGADKVLTLSLPYSGLNSRGLSLSQQVINYFGIPKENSEIVNIETVVEKITSSLDVGSNDKLRKGNVMARVRMIFLYDRAKMQNALVCGTENKSEYYLGYFTRFGDEASDIEPLRSFYKTQVYALAKEIGIPTDIISEPPTAGLWDGQTDEKQFGFSYKEADQILSLHFDSGIPFEDISLQDFPSRDLIQDTVLRNEFKHKVPYIR